MVRVHPSRIAVSESHSYSALIYDLAPWDDRALVGINRLRRWRPELPILFYVPPVSRAVALIPRCGGIGNVRFRMQEHSGNGMSEFRRDVAWLVQSVPSGEIITRLREAFPEMPSSLLQLARHVLRTPGVSRRPTVGSAARALRLSKRTPEPEGDSGARRRIDFPTCLRRSPPGVVGLTDGPHGQWGWSTPLPDA